MSVQGFGRRAIALLVGAAATFGATEQAAAAPQPANGFNVSFEASGSFSRDGTYTDNTQNGTVSTDGTWTASAKLLFPAYFPTKGTDKQTQNFTRDLPTVTLTGSTAATEVLDDPSNPARNENSSCTGVYDSVPQDVFPFAYRPGPGTDIQVLVAPSEFANTNTATRTCSDANQFALDQLFYGLQSTFDSAPAVVPDYEWSTAITLTQEQLNSNAFTVPVTYSLSGDDSWAVGQTAPQGNCNVSVYAGNGGQCTWTQSWSGTLKFERVCSAKEGGQVDFMNPQTGADGIERWFANGSCGGGAADACVVPDVEGKRLKSAKRKIKKADCKVGRVSEEGSKEIARGRVIKQKPKAGTIKKVGGKVKLVVSTG